MSRRTVEVKPEWWDDECEAGVDGVLYGTWPKKAAEVLEYCWVRGIRSQLISAKIKEVTGISKTTGSIRAKAEREGFQRPCL